MNEPKDILFLIACFIGGTALSVALSSIGKITIDMVLK